MKAASKANAPAPLRRRDEARALFRNAILDAAEAVFAEQGFHAARVQDIARHARIAVGTVYNHFDEKEDLLCALLDERTEAMLRLLRPQSGDPRAFAGKLTVRIARMLSYVESHRGFFSLAMEHGLIGAPSVEGSGALSGRSAQRLSRIRAAFRALIDEGIAGGELATLDAGQLAAFLGGTFRALLLKPLIERRERFVDLAPAIVDLFLHGAAPRVGKPARPAVKRAAVLPRPSSGHRRRS